MNNTLILGKKDSGKTTGYMFSKFNRLKFKNRKLYTSRRTKVAKIIK